MKASGLIVEYNPFHYGHIYHVQKTKEISGANVLVAIMSGSFLQRGEPALFDKFHRAKAALASGIDIIIELPYVYSVQHSDWFAKGAVHLLNKIGVSSICFGSEAGKISHFIDSYHFLQKHHTLYQYELKKFLDQGLSYPDANMHSLKKIGLPDENFDLSKPNNILGYSYVKTMMDNNLPIKPLTIKRIKNDYHDTEITNPIASATSIRKEIFHHNKVLSPKTKEALPLATIQEIENYVTQTNTLHDWEAYFPLLNYRVQTMSKEELRSIHGIDEGIEYRIIKTAKTAVNMQDWMKKMKTKRYTWTRIQRLFVHILTNTKKSELQHLFSTTEATPYLRLLGMTENGREYLNFKKKEIDVPIITSFKRKMHPMLAIEERASNAYYSILPSYQRKQAFQQELQSPLYIDHKNKQ